jgi:hypothetical protein
MTVSFKSSLQFKVERLELVINSKQRFSIDGLFSELNLYDNLFTPCVSGNILITDTLALVDQLKLNGDEKIYIKISKDGSENFSYEREFAIYSLTNKTNINMTSTAYVLNFVSKEFITSLQKKVNQNYIGSFTDIVYKLLTDTNYLGVTEEPPQNGESGVGVFQQSEGLQDLIFPTLTPFDAINFATQKAFAQNSPDFLFFETPKTGYNFISLSSLLQQQTVFEINFKPKNLSNTPQAEQEEFLGARDLKVLSQFSVLDSVQDGVYAGRFVGFDTLTKTTKITTIVSNKNLSDDNNKGYNEMTNSRVVSYPFALPRTSVEYIKENNPEAYSIIDRSENYVYQRKAIFTNLMQQRLQLVMPGNFELFSSRNIYLKVPKFSTQLGQDALDRSLSGKYIITGTRHIIKPNRHETVIEVCAAQLLGLTNNQPGAEDFTPFYTDEELQGLNL